MQIQAVVGKITDLCWEKCVSKPGANLTDAEKNVSASSQHQNLKAIRKHSARLLFCQRSIRG